VVFPSAGGAAAPASCPALSVPLVQPPVGRAAAPAPEPVVIVEEVSVGASVGPSGQEQVSVGSALPVDSGPPAQASVSVPHSGPSLGAQFPDGCPSQKNPCVAQSKPIPAVECRFSGGGI
jgi:hypothetical protein